MKFIIFIVLFFVLIGGIFGFKIGKLLFGSSSRSEYYRQNRQQERQNSSRKSKATPKLIQKDEGEYVDFEEIKE
jgi:3-hydroxy-3-methylglutaryl CoA synthase